MSLLAKLRVEFSDLRAHRCTHNFNFLSPICKFNNGEETITHFLMNCSRFSDQRRHHLSAVNDIIPDIASLSVEDFTRCLLYGDNTLTRNINHSIVSATITYIGSTKRFKKLEVFNHV